MRKIKASHGGGTHCAVNYKDGGEVYEPASKVCHGLGIAGAPKSGDAGAWAARIAKGEATMYERAIKGFTGTDCVMPAKGGCTNIDDDMLMAAVDHKVAM